ncbi:MAG: PQQ-like beta-propeller repeat protein, partial [Candidatus Hydrogenedentes bacterium]|nr:PQQ-like beta-propeller repeat protein [Candidatus Hydrogenedentota bacterium]
SIGGDLKPVVSWRWSPSLAELSKSLPRVEAHGTAVLPAELTPEDWPAFRGPARDNHVSGTIATDWTNPPRELWRRSIGPAWSSFAVVGDYLFTQEQRGEEELVTCYRADSGEEVWSNSVPARYDDIMGLGPRATPTYHEGRLFTQGATGILQCLDAATGTSLWKRELVKDAGIDVPMYGFASSPLVVDDLVIVFAGESEGKALLAYRRENGDIAWQAGRGSGGYSSPHYAVIVDVPQILMLSDFGLQSFEPKSGTLLWENAWEIKMNPRCVQPLVVDSESVMYGATGAYGSRLLRVQHTSESWKTEEVWSTKQFRPYFNDCVAHKGDCYGFDGERLACIDLKTGKRRWQGKQVGGQMLLLPEMDKLLVLSEDGEVLLIEAKPDRYSEVGRFKAISGKTWNHPVLVRGRLYVRNSEEVACFALGEGAR